MKNSFSLLFVILYFLAHNQQQQQQLAGPPRDWWAYYPLDKAADRVVVDQGKTKNHSFYGIDFRQALCIMPNSC